MVSLETLRKLILAYPETTEDTHFDKIAFRVKKKIIFTFDQSKQRACFKLSSKEQDLFLLIDKRIIYQVPNSWGKQGWTFVELGKIDVDLLTEILQSAYCHVAPIKWANLFLENRRS